MVRFSWVNPKFEFLTRYMMRARTGRTIIAINNSGRAEHAGCEQRWAWRAVHGLEPQTEARPLALGRAMHTGLALAYTKAEEPDREEGFRALRKELVRWAMDETNPDDWPKTSEIVEQASSLATRAMTRWWDGDRANVEIVGVELPFRLPLPIPGRVTKRGKPRVSMADATGVLDLVIRDRATGVFYVVDWKSWGGADRNKYTHELQWENARIGYVWALSSALAAFREDAAVGRASLDEMQAVFGTGGHLSFNAGRVAQSMTYRVIRKKAPVPPALNQHKPCKGAGCLSCGGTGKGEVSKVVSDTTADAYRALATTHPHIPPDSYKDHIAVLESKGAAFEWGAEVPVSPEQTDNWLRELYIAGTRMRSSENATEFLRNRRACFPLAGHPCPYRGLCEEDTEANRSAFRRSGAPLNAETETDDDDEIVPF